MNVLVVHQDHAIAEELAGILREHGLNALPLSRSLDALEHVEKLRFDVALLSTEMAGVALGEVLRHAHARRPWLATVLMGTHEDLGCVESSYGRKFHSLQIPCKAQALLDAVREAGIRSKNGSEVLQKQAILPSSERARVLVCDEREAYVEEIATKLATSSFSYEVRSTLNSIEAIETSKSFRPNVVFLGNGTPLLDRFKVADTLAKLLPGTKLILESEMDQTDFELCQQRGYPYHIFVPRDDSNLFALELQIFSLAYGRKPISDRWPHVLLVTTDEDLYEDFGEWLLRHNCDNWNIGPERMKDEDIQYAIWTEPDIVLLLSDIRWWWELTGVELAIFLFLRFPNTYFFVGRFDDGTLAISQDALACAQNYGVYFETVNVPFKYEDILSKIRMLTPRRKVPARESS
jgi:CheY-like chemotaxis protein